MVGDVSVGCCSVVVVLVSVVAGVVEVTEDGVGPLSTEVMVVVTEFVKATVAMVAIVAVGC